ncbi:MAG: cyclase family protein [Bryobacterales bacterium]|nr:cyclase family protein [Bryobacterales bacterium]
MTRLPALAGALFLSVACAPPPAPLDISGYRLIDLSHTFDEKTLYWPTDKHFEHNQVAWGRTEGGFWYSSFTYGGSEHGGTHIDAPIHFGEGKRSVDQIPIEQLIGSAVVIDISAACDSNPDYLLTVEDIGKHEQQHSRIEPGSIVMIRSGWSLRWPDAKQYLGSDVPGDTQDLHFPGVSPEAAEALSERHVAIVGIDTASIDHGPSSDFKAHQVFAAAQIACLENVNRLEELPPTGAIVLALPMKIGGGSGGPCRVVALIPPGSDTG